MPNWSIGLWHSPRLAFITPFDYHANLSMVMLIERLREFLDLTARRLNETIQVVNEQGEQIEKIIDDINSLLATAQQDIEDFVTDAINEATAETTNQVEQLRTDMDAFRVEMLDLIADSVSAGIVIDPTTGIPVPTQTALDRVYDNARTLAWRPGDAGWTVEQIEASMLTAREMDLDPRRAGPVPAMPPAHIPNPDDPPIVDYPPILPA